MSREYKKRKVDEGAPPVANLDLRGDLLEALDFEETDGGIKLGFFGDQAPKADGHLKFSGKEGTAPKRRSIPAEGQKFVSSIESEVEAMVAEAVAETIEPDASDFESVETASEFWEAIADYFPEMSRTKVKMTVLNSPSLTDFFESLGLMRFLK